MKLRLNRTFGIIFPLVFFLFFTSCDPVVEYNKIVQNDSDYDVKVLKGVGVWYFNGVDTIYAPIDTITISKGSLAVIYTFVGFGQVGEFRDCLLEDNSLGSMPMLIYFDDSIKVIPNINKMNYWNYRIINEGIDHSGKCECKMSLTNGILSE